MPSLTLVLDKKLLSFMQATPWAGRQGGGAQ